MTNLTPEEVEAIKREAEKFYPESSFGEIVPAVYISTATKYLEAERQRAKVLAQTMNDVDFILVSMEDYTHGIDGEKITLMRVKIMQALNTYNKTQP